MPAATHHEIRQVNGKRTATPEYRTWQMMKNRCNNPKARGYAYYGGRGIGVCPEWAASFETFLTDMGRRPTPSHSLDRIDADGSYSKNNCRWATRLEQARNRSYTRPISWCGQTMKSWEWAERLGVTMHTIHHYLWRISRGMMHESDIAARIHHVQSGGCLSTYRKSR